MPKSCRLLATGCVALTFMIVPSGALASNADIEVEDRCDPASFDAALGAGSCVRPAGDGGGSVTFDELLARLGQKREHGKWRFKDDKVKLKYGESLDIAMTRGGEFHTVTEVGSFGLGCVPPLNELVFPEENPTNFPAECDDPLTFAPGADVPGGTGILPGQKFSFTGLSKGTHKYMCMIHPWMNSTVTVK